MSSERYKIYVREAKKKGLTPISESTFKKSVDAFRTINGVINKQITNTNISDYDIYRAVYDDIKAKGYAMGKPFVERTLIERLRNDPNASPKSLAEDAVYESEKRAYKLVRMIKKKMREDTEFKKEAEKLKIDKISKSDFMRQTSVYDAFWKLVATYDDGFREVFYE